MVLVDFGDEFFGGDVSLLGAEHDRGPVGIIAADIEARMALKLLKAHPDVGLDMFHQVAEMNRAIGVGQGAGC